MKFNEGDRVRVIAWTPPAISNPGSNWVVCGKSGTIIKVRVNDPNANSDGPYKVKVDTNQIAWFRPCDLVAEDSGCTCDGVVRHLPVEECLIHDQPDPDPVVSAVQKLQALADGLSHDE